MATTTRSAAAQDARTRRNSHQPRPTIDPDQLLTDTYNACAFVRDHGENLHYCFSWKSWLIWQSTHWQRDESGKVMQCAKASIKRLAQQTEHLDDTAAIALLKHVKSSLATAKLKALLENAQSEEGIPIQPQDLDGHPWLLNCANGTLDLHTGSLLEHARTYLLTKCLPLTFDPAATCPTWQRFLWRIMGGTTPDPDVEVDLSAGELESRQKADERAQRLITFLQRAIGYSVTGDTREQCLFLLHGSGANGKSTFLEVLQALLGEYAQSTPSASLLAKERYDGIPNDIARLRGARVVSAVEIGEGKRLNEELIKRLTGQDTLTARFLHAEFFDFKAEFKLWIACNHLPTIKGTDHAIWRRVKRIPFTVTIPGDEQDKNLPAKLLAELPGILCWAILGCLAWQREGLCTPPEVIAATSDYRASMDVIGQFIEECCLVSSQVRVKASALYDAYKKWCEASGEYAATLKTVGNSLEDRGFTKQHSGVTWRLGIALREDADR
jgi:putative DNA primase/helicase